MGGFFQAIQDTASGDFNLEFPDKVVEGLRDLGEATLDFAAQQLGLSTPRVNQGSPYEVPNLNTNSGESRRISVSEDGITPWQLVYGEPVIGGAIVFREVTDSGKYLHFVIVLAAHECQEARGYRIAGTWVFPDQLDADGNVTSGFFKGVLRLRFHDGSQTSADSKLKAETSATSDYIYTGHTYVYVRAQWDEDVFARNSPKKIAVWLRGSKVTDPRTNNTIWTPNAALHVRNYFLGPASAGGINEDEEDVNE